MDVAPRRFGHAVASIGHLTRRWGPTFTPYAASTLGIVVALAGMRIRLPPPPHREDFVVIEQSVDAALVDRYGDRIFQLALRVTGAQADAGEVSERVLSAAIGK